MSRRASALINPPKQRGPSTCRLQTVFSSGKCFIPSNYHCSSLSSTYLHLQVSLFHQLQHAWSYLPHPSISTKSRCTLKSVYLTVRSQELPMPQTSKVPLKYSNSSPWKHLFGVLLSFVCLAAVSSMGLLFIRPLTRAQAQLLGCVQQTYLVNGGRLGSLCPRAQWYMTS